MMYDYDDMMTVCCVLHLHYQLVVYHLYVAVRIYLKCWCPFWRPELNSSLFSRDVFYQFSGAEWFADVIYAAGCADA